QTLILHTAPDESVASFKSAIEERGWPPTHVDSVSHDGVMMEAHKTLADFGIREGSTIVCFPFFSMGELAASRGRPLP
ncbi:hypothetical protein PENTCL1PPCAC_28392, partial [Pristionchus entomophagus]